MILPALKQFRILQKNQYLSPDQLKALQEEKLRKLVKHAYDNVPYYKKLFDAAGILPQDITQREHLRNLPITTKEVLKNLAPQELLARGVSPETCISKSTSGSTGKPLNILFSKREKNLQILVNLRILLAAGFRLTDTTAYIKNPHRFPKTKHWFQHFGILRREYLSVFNPLEVHANDLQRLQPDIIYSYPSVLLLLAHFIQKHGIEDIRPKAVFCSAEMLEPNARSLIAATMKTEVYDVLGLIEMGDIAWECPAHEGYHLNTDVVIIEFLDEQNKPVPPGQMGRLVCTSLYGYTMPLLRYEVGDRCVPSDKLCSCGRMLPLMKSVQGRVNDFIILSDGRRLSPSFSHITMQNFHDVAQYKVIQEDKERLLVQIVKEEGYVETTARRIKEEIEKAIHHSLEVRVETVQDIPRDPSGKIRTVVSQVQP